MKPANRFYGYSPTDPPEDVVMIRCTYCHKGAYSLEWRKNRGHCPLCAKPYAGKPSED